MLDCARRLPFAEGLAVVDSALRHGQDAASFARDVAALRGPGAPAARKVAVHCSPLAADPFESVLRALAIEADSWEFHGSKEMFQRDCRRYTALVADGWTVLRFTWWQVMHDPYWVLACLREVARR